MSQIRARIIILLYLPNNIIFKILFGHLKHFYFNIIFVEYLTIDISMLSVLFIVIIYNYYFNTRVHNVTSYL